MKIVCFLSSLSQPRCIKRVKSFCDAGFDVEVYGYFRGFYDVNEMPKAVTVIDWGKIASGNSYLSRFLDVVSRLRKVLSSNKKSSVLYYAFGFDFSIVLSILKPYSYVYESSDLIYTYFKSTALIRFFKFLDKWVIRRSYKVVFTSDGFRSYLFGDEMPKNVIVHPNRVSRYFAQLDRRVLGCKLEEGLVFAYVGAFRYPNTIFRFARLIGEKYPQHAFYFFGDSPFTYLAKELSEKYLNVRYFGKYKSPDDLEEIYSHIDVVVACYDTSTINERIAEPNKLYEAICFCKPIIVSKDTFLAKKVLDLKIGFAIDASRDTSIIDFMDNLDCGVLHKMSLNERSMEEEAFLDSSDDIVSAIKKYSGE